jgi:hypothetical protein
MEYVTAWMSNPFLSQSVSVLTLIYLGRSVVAAGDRHLAKLGQGLGLSPSSFGM